ncbi:MAG: beta-N-acetylhexosaminidase [Armatimonadaceae bacterium]
MRTAGTLPEIGALSLEEKIGQMLCLGWGGEGALLGINAQARACVQEMKAGGMVVMGRNLSPSVKPLPAIDAPTVRAMLNQLNEMADIPLLLPTDQEGGRVARFGTAPFTRMPPAMTVGERGDTELAHRAAQAVGRELLSVGVNWNFAPVADVNSNPENPVIGDRSFGTNPEAVTPMVVAQVRGYQEAGVLACAKHFPGHGDTSLDSHYDLPRISFNREAMEQRELVPFRAAIEAGVATIMTAHILFPELEPDALPATMSPAILTQLLRNQMGFQGLIVTDCLEMKAVADHWGTACGAVLAAKAGADMLLVCHTLDRQRETYAALLEAARSGELPIERIDNAVRRVLAAKQWVVQAEPLALTVIGSEEHVAIRQELTGETLATAQAPTTLGEQAPD